MSEPNVAYSALDADRDRIVDLPVEQLLLDRDNPRLAWREGCESQVGLVKLLWTEMAVDEVAWSIAENGFFRSEPLFVIRADSGMSGDQPRYTVIEGNRRLAAVLLLRDSALRGNVGAGNLPTIDAARRAGLDKLPALIYPGREELWTTVGFRHINGIKPWDSFSKAKYIAGVFETYRVPLEVIAKRIGDRHETVERLYRGYKILQQAESCQIFQKGDTARNRFYFSHLYTAAAMREFQDFLGIDQDSWLKPDPVPEERLPELKELLVWLYGKRSEGIEPIVRTQNPDLTTLRTVIARPDSLSALRSGHTLDQARDVAIGDKRRFREALTSAKIALQDARATVITGYRGESDLYDTVKEIVLYATTIRKEMDVTRAKSAASKRSRRGS